MEMLSTLRHAKHACLKMAHLSIETFLTSARGKTERQKRQGQRLPPQCYRYPDDYAGFAASDMRFRAAGLMVRRPPVAFEAGFAAAGCAAALRLAAHLAFIMADNFLRPAAVRRRCLACVETALAGVGAAGAASALPSSDSRAAMAWSRRSRSAFRLASMVRVSMCSPSMAIVTITYPASKSKRVVTQLVRLA
jgi:hypothetical protein